MERYLCPDEMGLWSYAHLDAGIVDGTRASVPLGIPAEPGWRQLPESGVPAYYARLGHRHALCPDELSYEDRVTIFEQHSYNLLQVIV